jgi:RNA polymerase sigma factor (sigma-70 family)
MLGDAQTGSELPDGALFARWKAGDVGAGAALFERHFDAIYRFFAHRVDGEATDLVQATFLACVEGRGEFRAECSFRTYLFAIARHQLFGHWRARRRSPSLDVATSSIAELAPSPSVCVARAEETRLVVEALRALPIDLQLALHLYHCEGLSARDLAAVLEVPEGTVRSRVRRARDALLAVLSGGEATARALAGTLTDLESWSDTLRAAGDPLLSTR